MLKRRALALPGAVVLMAALAACGAGSTAPAAPALAPMPVQQELKLQSVHIVNKGSEVFPGTAVTDFAPAQLSYSSTSSVSGNLQFNAVLAAEDFQRLAALVESARLISTLGMSTGTEAPCRHLGYEITIKRNDVTYLFMIPGPQTCGAAVRAGLNELLNLQAELLAKYTPKTGG
jgi:hypothetical protein